MVTGTFGDDGDGSPSGQVDVTFSLKSILGTCTFEATGTSNFTYTNGTGVLTVTSSSLHISTASGGSACDGADAGDPVNYTGTYHVLNGSGGRVMITPSP